MADDFNNWRIKPALHQQISVEAAKRGVTMYELAELAWIAFLQTGSTDGTKNDSISQNNVCPYSISGDKSDSKPSVHGNLKQHRMLDEILGSGVERWVVTITANLEWGSFMAARVKKGEKIEGSGDTIPEAGNERLDALGRESAAAVRHVKRAGRGKDGSGPANRKSAS